MNAQDVGNAFVRQFLLDAEANACIQPTYMPQPVAVNILSHPHGVFPAAPGLDYLAYGDLFRDANGYRMEAYLVTAGDHLVVLKRIQPPFHDPKDAAFQARMAATNLRWTESGPRSLADLLLDFERKQRAEHPQDHAIAPELKVNLMDSERRPLKLQPGEKRVIAFTLMDCDGVPAKGAQVQVETSTGEATPPSSAVGEDGSGRFTYTAPGKDASGSIRLTFAYVRGSGHAGHPAVDSLDVRVGAGQLGFQVTVDARVQAMATQHRETHHSEAVYTPYAGSDGNCTPTLHPGETCPFAISALRASASAQFPDGSHMTSTSNPGHSLAAEIIRNAQGATLRLTGLALAAMSPAEDSENYIGICAGQQWAPLQFELSEEEFQHFSTFHKTISISSPLGIGNCTGSGTLTLRGEP